MASAKASDDSVLPPPVGTARLNTPGACSAALRQATWTSLRTRANDAFLARRAQLVDMCFKEAGPIVNHFGQFNGPFSNARGLRIAVRFGVKAVCVDQAGEEKSKHHLPWKQISHNVGWRRSLAIFIACNIEFS